MRCSQGPSALADPDDRASPGATEYETNVQQNVRNIFGEDGEWVFSVLNGAV
jgi:hypothetical protein